MGPCARRSFKCNLDVEVVVEAINKGGPDAVKKYLCNRAVARRIATNGPVTVRNQVDSEEYPQEAKEIKKFFLPGMVDPLTPSGGRSSIISPPRIGRRRPRLTVMRPISR